MLEEYANSDPPPETDEEVKEPTKHITVAKNLPGLFFVYPESSRERLFVLLKQMSTFEQEGIRRIVALSLHEICRAYGGSTACHDAGLNTIFLKLLGDTSSYVVGAVFEKLDQTLHWLLPESELVEERKDNLVVSKPRPPSRRKSGVSPSNSARGPIKASRLLHRFTKAEEGL